MSIERMTTAKYAEKRVIGTSAVRKAIKMGHKLPGVEEHEKFGRDHVLYVDTKKLKEFLDSERKKKYKYPRSKKTK